MWLTGPSSFSLCSATSFHIFNVCLLVLAGQGQAWLPLLGGQRERLGRGCTMKEILLNSFCPSCYQEIGLWGCNSVLRGISSMSSLALPSFVASVSSCYLMIIHHRRRWLSEAVVSRVVCTFPRESTRQSSDAQEENIRTSMVHVYNLQIVSIFLVECALKFLTDRGVQSKRFADTSLKQQFWFPHQHLKCVGYD